MVAPSDAQLDASDAGMASSPFDCIIQIQTSSLAYRMVLYHQDPELRERMYSGGSAEEACEIEKFPEIHPADELLLLRNLKVTPLQFKTWLDTSCVRHSLTRAFFLAQEMATSKEVRKMAVFLRASKDYCLTQISKS